MKHVVYTFIVVFLLLSCRVSNKKETAGQAPVRELAKLEKLLLLPRDSVMATYDLSNDSIMAFPDLSDYTIISLNLSYNLLDTIIPEFLPKSLERLCLSHNRYSGYLEMHKPKMPTLKELDISFNSLTRIGIGDPLYRLIVSHNDLGDIDINHKNLQYLDISYNSNMSEKVSFEPLWIDTIIREGVADGKRLLGPMGRSYGYRY